MAIGARRRPIATQRWSNCRDEGLRTARPAESLPVKDVLRDWPTLVDQEALVLLTVASRRHLAVLAVQRLDHLVVVEDCHDLLREGWVRHDVAALLQAAPWPYENGFLRGEARRVAHTDAREWRRLPVGDDLLHRLGRSDADGVGEAQVGGDAQANQKDHRLQAKSNSDAHWDVHEVDHVPKAVGRQAGDR